MKDFGKLLKLFNYKDDKIFNENTIALLREKFKNIIKTYKIETCPNFIKDVSLFIYVNDKNHQDMNKLIQNTIEKYIKSVQTLTDIYINLASNYKDVSKNVVDSITNYFTKNKDKLNGEKILFLFQQLDSKDIIKSLLNKIDNYVIKEEEILKEEVDIDSFKLLKGIIKGKLLEKYPELTKTKYLQKTMKISQNFFKKIKKGEINYSSLYNMWSGTEKKKIFKQRLNSLFFNDVRDIKNCMKIITDKFQNIMKEIIYIKKLSGVLKEFYEISHQNNIKMLEKFEKDIKGGKLNLIEKIETQIKIKELHQILPDLDIKFKLKTSKFFIQIFRDKKSNSLKTEDVIFNETLEDFNKLKILFEKFWINKLDKSIIKQCYKVLNIIQDNNIKSQLKFLRDYFELKNIDDLYLDKLEDELKILSIKEQIFQTANNCLYFISELGAKPTDFSLSLKKLRKDISQNINADKIREYGKILVKYGINILEQKPEDKDYLNILSSLYSKKGSIKFILKLTDEDIHTLKELVSGSENASLTEVDIQDIHKCSNFIHSFGSIKDIKTDQELISILIENVHQDKTISSHFNQYIKNFEQILELLNEH